MIKKSIEKKKKCHDKYEKSVRFIERCNYIIEISIVCSLDRHFIYLLDLLR